MTFGRKNTLFLCRKHLFYERYLLIIRGLKRLSKVSEITLVTKLGPRQLTFSAKDAANNQKRCTFSQMEVKEIIRSVCFQILAQEFSRVCKGA